MKTKGWSTPSKVAVGLLALAGVFAVVLIPKPPRQPTVFVGHYGYGFKLTPEVTDLVHLTAAFRDPAKTQEVVFVYPKRMTEEEVFATPESSYTAQGILRLEVNSDGQYPPQARAKLLDAFKYAAAKTLDERKEPYRLEQLQGATLPGFAIEIGGPHPITQVFLKGGEFHYLVTSDRDNPVLHEILSSLTDPSKLQEAKKP